MDAAQLVSVARRWWWLLILGGVLAAAAYGMALRLRDQRTGAPATTYAATATFFVTAEPAPIPTIADAGVLTVLTRSYASIITGPGVAERIIGQLGLAASPDAVQRRISVETPASTQLIRVTAHGASPDEAQSLLDGVTHALLALRQQGNLPGNVQTVEVNSARPVAAPSQRSARIQTALLVALLGVVAAGGIVAAFEYATDAVRDRREAARAAGLPLLAAIPLWNVGRSGPRAIAIAADPESAVAERYRMLRTAIAQASGAQPAQVLLVAAAVPGAGATTTAANLAATLAHGGLRVALLDADMRTASASRVLDATQAPGLSDLLTDGAVTLDRIARPALGGVTLLPAGAPAAAAPELLALPRFGALLADLRGRFDAVVIDAPPALLCTDAAIIAAQADLTLLVARGDVTRRRDLRGAAEVLRPGARRLGGIVLNCDPDAAGGGFRGFRVRVRRAGSAAVRA